jgi:hypothetical protein
MSDPCQYNDDIQSLKKAVFIGNGQPSLLTSMASVITKIDNIHTVTNTWDAKMDSLLDFMAGEKAIKQKSEKRWKYVMWALGIGVTIISVYLNNTKATKTEVQSVVKSEIMQINDNKVAKAKDASYKKEIKSQLSKDTLK